MTYVLGGSGFIGTRLCRRLHAAGRSFAIIDKAPSVAFPDRTHRADLRRPEELRTAFEHARGAEGADKRAGARGDDDGSEPAGDNAGKRARKSGAGPAIVNLAAEHRDDVRPRRLYDEVNVEGARNVCRLARELGLERLVFTSTVAVYGFAPPGTDETGEIAYFNDYGRTKWAAEEVYRAWQAEDPARRSLTIVRPTVVFGERNRGNVYNLLNQIASGRFVMIGNGRNRKSMAYVENVAAFIEHTLGFGPGVHTYNYIDKPDLDMNTLVQTVRAELGRPTRVGFRVPYPVGLALGYLADGAAALTRRGLPLSSVRVRKFCATTEFACRAHQSGFLAPVPLGEALRRTVAYEFGRASGGGAASPAGDRAAPGGSAGGSGDEQEPLFFSE